MEFELKPDPAADDATSEMTLRDDRNFRLSSQPIVEETMRASEGDEPAELPRSSGIQTLWLMPRDPQSLFAFWNVDWRAAFQDPVPTERKVHLRLMRDDGSEETALEVEPMASSCYIPVASADESYMADLGFYEPAGAWNSVAVSATVQMPSSEINEGDEGEFATIPLHLSFQRMIDAFRVTHHESASITEMLTHLRARVASADTATTAISSEEREIARALDQAAINAPEPQAKQPAMPDLSARMEADRVLGLGATSPRGGFGGNSSRG
jgi:hypothetical protein